MQLKLCKIGLGQGFWIEKRKQIQGVKYFWGKFSISPGIPTASPFCKGGLRGIFLMQPGFIENLPFWKTGKSIFRGFRSTTTQVDFETQVSY